MHQTTSEDTGSPLPKRQKEGGFFAALGRPGRQRQSGNVFAPPKKGFKGIPWVGKRSPQPMPSPTSTPSIDPPAATSSGIAAGWDAPHSITADPSSHPPQPHASTPAPTLTTEKMVAGSVTATGSNATAPREVGGSQMPALWSPPPPLPPQLPTTTRPPRPFRVPAPDRAALESTPPGAVGRRAASPLSSLQQRSRPTDSDAPSAATLTPRATLSASRLAPAATALEDDDSKLRTLCSVFEGMVTTESSGEGSESDTVSESSGSEQDEWDSAVAHRATPVAKGTTTALVSPAAVPSTAPAAVPEAAASAPKGSWGMKKSYNALCDTGRRLFLSCMSLKEKITALIEEAMHTDRREVDDVSIMHALHDVTAQISNETTGKRGFQEGIRQLEEDLLQSSVPRSRAVRMAALAETEYWVTLTQSLKRWPMGSVERARLLTHFVAVFRLREVNTLILGDRVDLRLGRREYKRARINAFGWGVGNIAPKDRRVRRTIREENAGGNASVTFATEVVKAFLHPVAYGEHTMPLSTGGEMTFANIELTVDRATVIVAYRDAVKQQQLERAAYLQRLRQRTGGGDPGNAMEVDDTGEGEELEGAEEEKDDEDDDEEDEAEPQQEGQSGEDGIDPWIQLEIHAIPAAHLNLIIEALSGGETANLAALDPVHLQCLVEGGDNFRQFITAITQGEPLRRALLMAGQKETEEFLHRLYPTHLFDNSQLSNHSMKYAFTGGDDADSDCSDGDDDESEEGDTPDTTSPRRKAGAGRRAQSGKAKRTAFAATASPSTSPASSAEPDQAAARAATEHALFCEGCARVQLFHDNVRLAISQADLSGQPESREELGRYFEKVLLADTARYIGHVVRKTHEVLLEQLILDKELGADGVLVRIDFKMKMLALLYRESMPQFFGRAGFPWGGVSFTRRKTAAEKEADPVGECVVEFFDILLADTEENARAAFALLLCACLEYRKRHSWITKAVVLTDGAACFACLLFAILLSSLGELAGLFVAVHIVLECGCGKSYLDGHFVYGMAHVRKVVAAGQGKNDVTGAEACAKALAELGGVGSSTAIYCELAKQSEPTVRSPKGFTAYHQRQYVYTPEGALAALQLFLIPFFLRADEPDHTLSADNLRAMVPDGQLPRPTTTQYRVYQPDPRYTSVLKRRTPHHMLTPTDHATKLEKTNNARLQRQAVAEDAAAAKAREEAVRRSLSQVYECHCGHQVISEAWFIQHVNYCSAAPRKDPRTLETDRDAITRYCHTVTQGVQHVASLSTLTSANRTECSLYPAEHFSAWTLYDGITPFDVRESLLPRGFGLVRKGGRRGRLTLKALDFMIFMQQRGEETGTNTIAAHGALAMRHKGTLEGATYFRSTPRDREVMAPNAENKREFKMGELRSELQIKTYLRQSLADLLKQRENLVAKLAEEEWQRKDPLRRAIYQATAAILRKTYAVLHQIRHGTHADIFTAHGAPFQLPKAPVGNLRSALWAIYAGLGRLPEDVELMIPTTAPAAQTSRAVTATVTPHTAARGGGGGGAKKPGKVQEGAGKAGAGKAGAGKTGKEKAGKEKAGKEKLPGKGKTGTVMQGKRRVPSPHT